ncbi:MAG: NAD(P)/FAD-dependent oxidoreductase [Thermodesulfobacteriota bacterium]
MLRNNYDVVVVGGGPSGLQTAGLLCEKGFSVALFDKEPSIGDNVVCSGVISKEAFRRYDLPADSIVGRLKEAVLHSPSDNKIKYVHPDEDVVVVNRKLFDSQLGIKASQKGAAIFNGSKVLLINSFDEFAEAKVRYSDRLITVRAKLIVIATGVSFNLQSSVGMGRPKSILKGIQTEISSPDIKELNLFWGNKFSKGFFGWGIPLLNGNLKVGVMTKEDPFECLKYTLKKLGKENFIYSDELELKRRGISFGAIKKSYANRVIAVGEAAGLVKTTTGGGIYYGLISAEIASELILKAFTENRFNEKFLSKYQKMINSCFSKEIKFGEFFHKFYSTLSDYQINQLFDAAKEDRILDFISERGKFDWHKDTVVRIFKSPNLRNVLIKELLRRSAGNLALNI